MRSTRPRSVTLVVLSLSCIAGVSALFAQERRAASPRGSAATQVAGDRVPARPGAPGYVGGKWIEISYGRPILRQRSAIFGDGPSYGEALRSGAPVWRLGADRSTRMSTEVDLMMGGTRVPAGEYSLFVDLAGPTSWTLIVSSWGAQERFDPEETARLWGSLGYTPEKDVARAPMTVATVPIRVDQLTIGFVDVEKLRGTIAVWWDTVMATVPFEVAASS
jgi:hypothetical protein